MEFSTASVIIIQEPSFYFLIISIVQIADLFFVISQAISSYNDCNTNLANMDLFRFSKFCTHIHNYVVHENKIRKETILHKLMKW